MQAQQFEAAQNPVKKLPRRFPKVWESVQTWVAQARAYMHGTLPAVDRLRLEARLAMGRHASIKGQVYAQLYEEQLCPLQVGWSPIMVRSQPYHPVYRFTHYGLRFHRSVRASFQRKGRRHGCCQACTCCHTL